MFGSRETFNLFILRRQSNKPASLLLIFFILCLFGLPIKAQYGGGTGEQNDPYLIWTAEQMNAIGAEPNDWDKHFKLMADIDLAQYTGEQFNIIGTSGSGPFSGVFDGDGHAISNFECSVVDMSRVGLFGRVSGENAQIKNLRLVGPVIYADTEDYVGSLIGYNHGGTITACSVENGVVLGNEKVGGLIGFNVYGFITECFSTANVSGATEVGGLVGANTNKIMNCYSTGNAVGNDSVGGLVGSSHNGSVLCSYSTAIVKGNLNTGGLIGGTTSSAYLSYWDIQTSGMTTSTAGDGLTTEYLMNTETFRGWGCDEVWAIDDGTSYPHLIWEGKPGQSIMDESRSYGSGEGTIENPYQIWTAEQFTAIHWYWRDFDKHFVLMADLNLDLVDPNQYGSIGTLKLPFTGTFNGNGHTISNWTNNREENYIGVFGYIKQLDPNLQLSSGLVKDLNITNLTAIGSYRVGSIVGFNEGTITSCTVSAEISADRWVGGLAGDNQGLIESCRTTGQITGQMEVGGAVGYNEGDITDCYSETIVTGNSYVGGLVGVSSEWFSEHVIHSCHSKSDVSGNDYVGGLIGYTSKGAIISCSSEGQITGNGSVGGLIGKNRHGTARMCYSAATISGSGYGTGGLIGWNDGGFIEQCFSTGQVEGLSFVGGLVGRNYAEGYPIRWRERNHIEFCYAQGNITGSDKVGGLVGYNQRGAVSGCYSTGQVTGDKSIGGLVGEQAKGPIRLCFWDTETSGLSTSAGGSGKTTDQLMMADTFVGWGNGVWRIDQGRDYPRLAWEQNPGQLIGEIEPRYEGGAGTVDDPYQIWTAGQLMELAYHPEDYNKSFALMADLDMAVIDPNKIVPIGMNLVPFIGIFEGNGHTLSNFVYESEDEDCVGLFASVGPGFSEWIEHEGVIRNLHLANVRLHGKNQVGGIAGECRGTVNACSVTGNIQGKEWIGGLVGRNLGNIGQCWTATSVTGEQRTGGLVGYHGGGLIHSCYVIGDVWGHISTGGLAGFSYGGWIQSSYSRAQVTGGNAVGGLVGQNGFIGGVVRSYSNGPVTGNSNIGGLVGIGETRCAFMSFWDIDTSGVLSSAGGNGKTTAQMFVAETFEDWALSGDWTIDEGADYPRLAWEDVPGTQIVGQPYTYGGGSGQPEDPYQLRSAEQFISITDHYEDFDKCFVLMADIDLNDIDPYRIRPIGTYSVPFTGIFDGNYHTINNFHYEATNEDRIGLFGYLGTFQSDGSVSSGTVKNLHLVNLTVTGNSYVGGLAGSCYGGTLASCSISGSVAGGSDIGGLVGLGFYMNISSSSTSGIVEGYRTAGGLVGRQEEGQITQSYSSCEVIGHEKLGGLVGDNSSFITNSYAACDVIGEDYTFSNRAGPVTMYSNQVGGLVGTNNGQITNCYSTSKVTGSELTGGLVGNQYNNRANVANVAGSFWDIDTSGQISSAEGDGKTTVEMQNAGTFLSVSWDFVDETENGTEDIWWILEGRDYPRLWWEALE